MLNDFYSEEQTGFLDLKGCRPFSYNVHVKKKPYRAWDDLGNNRK